MLILRRLVVFFVIGLGLHYLQQWYTGSSTLGRIAIDANDIEQISLTYKETHKRYPSAQELAKLLEKKLEDELLHKEALRLGLHKDDTVVKARLHRNFSFTDVSTGHQKPRLVSDFVAHDVVIYRRLIERMKALIVTEASNLQRLDIKKFYLANIEKYSYPTRYRIQHQFTEFDSNNIRVEPGNYKQSFIDSNKLYSLKNLQKVLPDAVIAELTAMIDVARFQKILVKQRQGIHEVKLLEIVKPEPVEFNYIRNAVAMDLRQNLKQKQVAAYLNKIKAFYQIEMTEPMGAGDV
ncbi:MAG: hypothetical protein MI976_11590 [Pseudomonadales bacterium]|nr:hypothetical protein [Pseudomonadales bacterium]